MDSIQQAKQICIETKEEERRGLEKLMELIKAQPISDANKNEYKTAWDSANRLRIEIKILKGQHPEHEKKKSKIRW